VKTKAPATDRGQVSRSVKPDSHTPSPNKDGPVRHKKHMPRTGALKRPFCGYVRQKTKRTDI
jgi:hypothetical protein